MPTVTLNSQKFPGLGFFCPQLPNEPERSGTHQFHVGRSYQVTDETLARIQKDLANFPYEVKNFVSLTVLPDVPVAVGVDAPLPPPKSEDGQPPVPPTEQTNPDPAALVTNPGVEQLTELTAEDQELIQVEVNKLLGRTIAEAVPMVTATGGNPDMPLLLRQAYLQEVMTNPELYKGVQKAAEELLKEIK